MKKNKNGFTLIELVVVVLIMGILAAIALPQYRRTVEVSKADAAVGLAHMISGANRMYFLDNNNYGYATEGDGWLSSGHGLVLKKYVADQDWANLPYRYMSGPAAVVADRQGGDTGYGAWGYTITNEGVCTASGGAPDCPAF